MEESYISALDDFICARYSDYVKISALEGYKMPEVITVAKDGNIVRRDSSVMRLELQPERDALLKKFKDGLADTNYTFSFAFIPFRDRVRDRFSKYTFAKVLPDVLAHYGETGESVGEKLAIEPRFWRKIVKGKLYPEKGTVLALALVCRMQRGDVDKLLNVCGYSFAEDNVRDLVVEYLLSQSIFNPEMRDRCLAEYHITNLPIKRNNDENL